LTNIGLMTEQPRVPRRSDPRTRRRETARTGREQSLLREVRWRLSKDQVLPARLRRIEQMEHTARLWVNGREVEAKSRYRHLSTVHD
jgi:hypothetical protein